MLLDNTRKRCINTHGSDPSAPFCAIYGRIAILKLHSITKCFLQTCFSLRLYKLPAHADLESSNIFNVTDCCPAIHHMAVMLAYFFSVHHHRSLFPLRIYQKHLARTKSFFHYIFLRSISRTPTSEERIRISSSVI